MNITLENKSTTDATVNISLEEKDYRPKVEEKIKEYSRKAGIKGFRPGKVPISVIKKMYGKGILVEEVNAVLAASVNEYIKENKINIIGEPLPNREDAGDIDWETQKEFDFKFDIGLVPDFKCDVSASVKLTSYEIEPDKKIIDETIDNLRKKNGKMANPEVSKAGDFIFGTLAQKESEFEKDVLIPLNQVDKAAVKQFIGIKKDDVIKFDLQKAFKGDEKSVSHLTGLTPEEAAGLTGQFEFTVKNINRTEPADMDAAFFDKILGPGKVSTEAEFINEITALVKNNLQNESESFLIREIRDHLIEKAKIRLPKAFLKKWLLATNEGSLTEEGLEKEFDHYLGDLQWTLIRNRLLEEFDIKADNEEVKNRARAAVLSQFGGNIQITEETEKTVDVLTDNYLRGNEGKNYMRTYEDILFEKLLIRIKSNITLKNKKISLEEFNKLVEKIA